MGLPQILEAVRRKNENIYIVSIFDIEISFRLLPIKKAQQYAHALASISDEALRVLIFEYIYNEVIEDDWLKESKDIPAGIPESLSNLVLFLSGIGKTEESELYIENLIVNERNSRMQILTFMQRIICSTFSGYTFEILESLSFPEIIKIFVQAESALLEVGRINEEYDIITKEDKKNTNASLAKQINEDLEGFKEFDRPRTIDPRYEQMRKQAILKAEQEEEKYRSQLRK
jgi:hypothetical protein